MPPNRAQQARELFLAAVDSPPEQRSALLDEQCGSDAALRAEVESLLAHDDVAPKVMDEPLVAPGTTPPGQHIGRYEIKRTIASGGMGTVYEAVQDHPHRPVALKVMRHGAASSRAMRRFQHEAEILGRLRHANIAQIYEAGTFDEGHGVQPYFAMELVKGQPLPAYCESAQLGTRQRLALFARICDAVQYAHQQGIIHRDLKPDNVLIDDSGEPKILDFGIARATDADVQTATLRTDIGQLIGTVPYMSPEQVTGDPGALDTRSDIYSLGVVLYELLCGRLPHDLREKNIPEAIRMIREEDPTPLSSINRVFRGDVETIVAKALDKDRDRRYQTAAELAADVRRYLQNEPIVARPPSTFYQLRKFARRNRALVAGVVGMFALLVAGIVGTSTGFLQARNQARNEAETNEFLMELFTSGATDDMDPYERTEVLTLEQLIDEASSNLSSAFPDRPDVRADMLLQVGRMYRRLGRYDDMESDVRQAHELYAETLGDDDPRTLVCLSWHAYSLDQLARHGDAVAEHRQALEGLLAICEPHDQRALAAALLLGDSLRSLAKYEESAEILQQAIETARDELGETHEVTLEAVRRYAYLLHTLGKNAEEEEVVRPALEAARKNLPAGDFRIAKLAWSLGTALRYQKRHADAAEAFREAHEAYHHDNPGIIHPAIYNTRDYAHTLSELRRFDEAEALLRDKLADCRRELSDNHRFTLWMQFELGEELGRQGRFDEAETMLRETVDHYSRVLGGDHHYVVFAKEALARVLRAMNKLEDACEVALEAYEARNRANPDDEYALKNRYLLGDILTRLGRFEEAEKIYREQIEVQTRVHAGRLEEAEPLLRDSLAGVRQASGENNYWTHVFRWRLAQLLVEKEDYAEAEPLFLTIYEGMHEIQGENHKETLRALKALAEFYEAWSKPEKAAEYRELLQEAQDAIDSD
ncbi:MAG: protein kinase domain-containing protein [Planctomycetota bacterium]|jgi:serine/threonine protein kinase